MLSSSKAFNFADIALSLPIETLESSLKKNQELVFVKGFGGQTALHKAVLVGNHSVTLILLRYGANPNLPTDTGETSLHIACSKGALKLLLPLINFGGDLNVRNRNGHLPLHCASQSGSIIIVQLLSEVHGSNLELPDANGATVLHGACAGGHLDLVRFLLEKKKVFCNDADSNGNTILHCGAMGGVSGVCWCILTQGGESLLLTKNKNGQTPLQVAQSSLSVSRDCKKWMEKWTRDYERRKRISNPKMDWYLLLLTPFIFFHSTLILSVLSFPESQWITGVPGFGILLCILRKQQHRIGHPARWANPFYVGAYLAGLSSTGLSYLGFFQEQFAVPAFLLWGTLALFTLLLYFLFRLLTKDPGRIPLTSHAKDTLMRYAEDRLEGRYCPLCSLSAPSASHHCRLCEKCFLHLDHHCLFLNACVAANNHWHFVVFVVLNIACLSSYFVTCVFYVPVARLSLSAWFYSLLTHWLCNDVWTLLLLFCHVFSIAWGCSLLKYQYNVIGTQQTTFHRLKAGAPKTKYSSGQKIGNFLKFLYFKKIALRNASHYFEA